MIDADFIAIDWGTSRARAYLCRADLTVLDSREGDHGILTVPEGGYPAVFASLTEGWKAESIWLAGMVGSRNGWREAPYVALPATSRSLARMALNLPIGDGQSLRIIPGVSHLGADGEADVMRGEEVLCLGAGITDGLICLPGTHAKWVTMQAGAITSFRSFMTGEVYGAMIQHTILSRLAGEPPADPSQAVLAGAAAQARGGGVLGTLFQARARVLLGTLEPEAVKPFIVGLLIGEEVENAVVGGDLAHPITLVATGPQARDYATILTARAIPYRLVDPGEAFRRGVAAIAAEA
jgi:2-dehydro-3-deoxygalactonokinase